MSFSQDAKLAFYLPALYGGGAERVTVNLLRVLTRMELPIDMVLAKAEGPYLSEVPDAVRVIDLQSKGVMSSVPRLARYLKQEQPAALVSAMGHANIAALFAHKLAGSHAKVATVDHSTMTKASSGNASLKQRFVPLLVRQLYHLADGVAAVSRGVANDLSKVTGIDKDKIKVLYNPVVRNEMFVRAREAVSHDWLNGAEINMPVIIAVGRLCAAKDFLTLIRAFVELRKRREARLVILGEGNERPMLEREIEHLGVEDCVLLPGFADNPYAYMSRAQLFVLSSQWEGLPTALIEALALGLPVVSTDCESGPREILEQGKYGRLVPVGDHVALASAMLMTLEEPVKAVPQESWQAFTEDAAAANYLEFIRGL